MSTKYVTRLEREYASMTAALEADDSDAFQVAAIKWMIAKATIDVRAKAARRYAYNKAGYGKPALSDNIADSILGARVDMDYILYLTLNVEAFDHVVRAALPHMNPLRPSTLAPAARVKRSRGAEEWTLTCEGVIALTLRWLSTRHLHKDLQLEFRCSQSTVSHAIKEGLRAIVAGLREDPLAKVIFPSRDERDGLAELARQQYGTAPYPLRFFACADGTILLCLRPPTEAEQLRMYSGKVRNTSAARERRRAHSACASYPRCSPPPPPPSRTASTAGTTFSLSPLRAESSP